MSAAATLPDLCPQAGSAAPGRFAPLLCLVRRILDYGRQLAASLQNPTPETDLHTVARTFGSYDFGEIVASIIRGLHRAQALQTKLERLDISPQPEPCPIAAPAKNRPRARRPSRPRSKAPLVNVVRMATPEQIARQVRGRPIGAVLADICRDLGIRHGHPLWQELHDAILEYNGSLARLCYDIGLCPWLDPDTRQPITSGVPLFCRRVSAAGAGPPA